MGNGVRKKDKTHNRDNMFSFEFLMLVSCVSHEYNTVIYIYCLNHFKKYYNDV